jgi:hypothetical protein
MLRDVGKKDSFFMNSFVFVDRSSKSWVKNLLACTYWRQLCKQLPTHYRGIIAQFIGPANNARLQLCQSSCQAKPRSGDA